jgi:hypothetical protein
VIFHVESETHQVFFKKYYINDYINIFELALKEENKHGLDIV